jgi:hypothetical protein
MNTVPDIPTCVWCGQCLPTPATRPFIASRGKAICMACIASLYQVVADQASRGRVTRAGRLTENEAEMVPQSYTL